MYKNDYANCITNDTGILTVPFGSRSKQSKVQSAFAQSYEFEIELNYFEAINEEMDKFDEHLCVYTASIIETKIRERVERCHQKECLRCIYAFKENLKVQNDFMALRNATSSLHQPCISTVDIIKATNKILGLLECQNGYTFTFERVLSTVMSHLCIEKLYTQSNFNLHDMKKSSGIITHQEQLVQKIVNEYMKLKSSKIGNRISEEERGVYIRHNNKKRIHEAGQ